MVLCAGSSALPMVSLDRRPRPRSDGWPRAGLAGGATPPSTGGLPCKGSDRVRFASCWHEAGFEREPGCASERFLKTSIVGERRRHQASSVTRNRDGAVTKGPGGDDGPRGFTINRG